MSEYTLFFNESDKIIMSPFKLPLSDELTLQKPWRNISHLKMIYKLTVSIIPLETQLKLTS